MALAVISLATPVDAACGPYNSTHGAYWRQNRTDVFGDHADLKIYDTTVSTYVVREIWFILSSGQGDAWGWGVFKGSGSYDCPSTSVGWRPQLEYINFGEYYCTSYDYYHHLMRTYSYSDGLVGFRGDGRYAMWNFSLFSGGYSDYLVIAPYMSSRQGQGEVVVFTPATTPIDSDTHFNNMIKEETYGNWTSWSAGTSCHDSGYTVDLVANDNVWFRVP